MRLAIDKIKGNFDTVVVLDADNLAPPNFLSEINKMRAIGTKTIQVHRKGIINQSQISLLDGLSEEINTCFFRKGHQVLGLSPALSGSGMVFEYKWFKENIHKVWTSGEDKELEALLLKQKEKILYTHHLCIYDKKTDKQNTISQQRKRWMAAQYHALMTNLPHLPHAIISLNFSYIDKIIQWMLLPRLIQLTLVFGITLLLIIFNVNSSYKWIILSIVQIISMVILIPKKDWNATLFQSLMHIPKLAIITITNIFNIKETKKNFIHTKHE
jgi:cellulose synthase/poly-beta-1,6-N-acetylglucosamine synthase-like glycosyltransferase